MRSSTSPIFIITTILLVLTILALGGWWLYLLSQFSDILYKMGNAERAQALYEIVKWEGGSFLIIILLLIGAIVFLFYKDKKKTKSLSEFYSGLTHEFENALS